MKLNHTAKRTQNNLGSIECYNAHYLKGTRLKFLNKWIRQISKEAKQYVAVTKNDAPFLYTEREMNGSMLIALSKISSACLAELHTRRKNHARLIKDRTEKHGRVDFWAKYENRQFYIEAKHGYAYYDKGPDKSVKDKFYSALNQHFQALETNKKNAGSKWVSQLAIQSVVLLRNSKDDMKPDWVNLIMEYNKINSYIGKTENNNTLYKPQWMGLIKFSQDIVKATASENDKGEKEEYLGILFIAAYLDFK